MGRLYRLEEIKGHCVVEVCSLLTPVYNLYRTVETYVGKCGFSGIEFGFEGTTEKSIVCETTESGPF